MPRASVEAEREFAGILWSRLLRSTKEMRASYPECGEPEEYPPLPPDVQASVIARLVEAASEPALTNASSLSGLCNHGAI